MSIITICGSMSFAKEMLETKLELEKMGFQVETPDISENGGKYEDMTEFEQYEFKNQMIQQHLDKIKKSQAILVFNESKNDIYGYIGANTFLEMGFAFCLKMPIFLYNEIPKQPNNIEIGGLKPILIYKDLTKIILK